MPGEFADMLSAEKVRLLDENEQLRTALESALEENALIVEDRDRLLRRVTVLAREFQAMQGADARLEAGARSVEQFSVAQSEAQRSQTEEELRVAFEELTVLAEELEVANTSLERANAELELRVAMRTRELAAANADLRRTELRLNSLVEGIPQLVWRAVGRGDWTWCSSQWTDYTGQSEEECRQMGWLQAFHPDDRQIAVAAWERAETHDGLSFEARIADSGTGHYRFFQTRARPVRTQEGVLVEWLGTCTDIDTIIKLQEQQALLVAELQHRTRNLMGVVHAVMLRTLKGSNSLEDFRRRIDQRLGALARVQGLLSRRGGHRVAFDTLLREELSAHVGPLDAGGASQVSLEGPPGVPLENSLVQTFALALHELATNAVKYGALATPNGRLRVHWTVHTTAAGVERLHVDWRETGVTDLPGPESAPVGSGYGRELIERALPYQLGATTTYGFATDGVHCTIEVDVPPKRESRERTDAE